MEIKKKITLSLTKRNGRFIAHSSMALAMVLGTSAAQSNQHLYKVEKVKGGWAVLKEVVEQRLDELKQRRTELDDKIEIIEQILRGE
jgi:hypothetical protein